MPDMRSPYEIRDDLMRLATELSHIGASIGSAYATSGYCRNDIWRLIDGGGHVGAVASAAKWVDDLIFAGVLR